MYVVVGHSIGLRAVMDEKLHEEITRGLWWFMCSLIGGVAICFIIFSYCFEQKLQKRVTRPIMELSNQIKNPKEFMAARNKSVDIYTRRSTFARKFTPTWLKDPGNSSNTSNDASTEIDMVSHRSSEQDTPKRGSSFGRTIIGRAFSSYERQLDQDQKMSNLKSINEVAALRSVFYNFFDTQAVNSN